MVHFMAAPFCRGAENRRNRRAGNRHYLDYGVDSPPFSKLRPKVPLFRYEMLPLLLEVYAFICLLVALIAVNRLPLEILMLAS